MRYFKYFLFVFITMGLYLNGQGIVDISSDLIVYWKFDEGTDTIARDVSGYHMHGVLRNAGWTGQGKFGKALSIENGIGYMGTKEQNLEIPKELSVSFWIYRKGPNGSGDEWLVSRNKYGRPFFINVTKGKKIKAFIRGINNGVYVTANTSIQDSVWNHIVVTYKSGEIKIYINGNLDKVDTTLKEDLYYDGKKYSITVGSTDTSNFAMYGYYDEVRIYTRALSASDVRALYDGTGLDATPPLPVGYVYDGLNADMDSTISQTSLSASWGNASDPDSKITKYYYAIGTSPGGSNVVDWTSNSVNTSVFYRGLNLTVGMTYYFSVKAENSSGLQSTVVSSDGIKVVQGNFPNLIEQVKDTLAHWKIDLSYTQYLPPLSEILNRPHYDVRQGGLFTWHTIWQDPPSSHRTIEDIDSVGIKTVRVGSYYNTMPRHDEIKNMALSMRNLKMKVLYTLLAKQRYQTGEFSSDEQWIDSVLAFVDRMIGTFGPNGSFFKENPDVPYEPVIYWEVWNEPALYYMLGRDYWNALNEEGKADLYARMLMAVYRHIRSKPEWNDVKVVAMSLVGTGFFSLVNDAIIKYGGNPRDYYDIVSFHPYVGGPPDVENVMIDSVTGQVAYRKSVINMTKTLRDLMAKYGVSDKPVWFTEIGWSRYNGLNPPTGRPYPVLERQQAAYVVRLYALALRLGIDHVHIMFVSDGDGSNSGFFYTITEHGKLVYRGWYEVAHAVRNFYKVLPAPKIIGALSDGEKGLYAYWMKANENDPNSKTVLMAWNAELPMAINFPASNPNGDYLLVDMFGNTAIIKPQNGQLEIPIGPYPVYLMEGTEIPTYTFINPPEELKVTYVDREKGRVGLSWLASSSSGVSGYHIIRNGEVVGSTSGTSYEDSGILSDRDYTYAVRAYTASGVTSIISNEVQVLRLRDSVDQDDQQPMRFELYQNYPNPFNPVTRIQYEIPSQGRVLLKVYDILGREVAKLVDEVKQAGKYEVEFDGSKLSSGVYFYKLMVGDNAFVRKMVLIK
ncbi:MAG: LamG-like jellyroll fold domain-containing protein [candidate division WOR-3 bacterium]